MDRLICVGVLWKKVIQPALSMLYDYHHTYILRLSSY